MIAAFAAQRRKEWPEGPVNPGTFMKHWRPISTQPSKSNDPFAGKKKVTTAELEAAYPNDPDAMMRTRSRLIREGRY